MAVLEVTNLSVRLGPTRAPRTIVNEVSLSIAPGRTLGLVGESGSGKTTLARAIMRLLPVAAGSVRLCGEDLLAVTGMALRKLRRSVQMVFQDPFASLNPRHRIGRIVREGLDAFDIGPRQQRDQRVHDELQRVGLPPEFAQRYPHELSGGQRQRVSIARAIIIRPALVVCDEPVSALDMTVQSRVVALLKALQAELGLSYLFIGHHLGVMRQVSHELAVMQSGRIVEHGSTDAVLDRPQHEYTQSLVSCVLEPPPFLAG